MDEVNDYTLQNISKKYSNGSTKLWEHPPPEVVRSVEKVLLINKSKSLEPLTRSKKLEKVNDHLNLFVEEFLTRLEKAKLPKNLDPRDFDYDYQLKREIFLQKLCSDELKVVENLEDALDEEEAQLREIETYVSTYQKLYNEQLKKLEELDYSDVVKRPAQQGEVRFVDLELNDDEIKDILDELEAHLSKLDQRFEPLQDLSSKLDDVIQSLS